MLRITTYILYLFLLLGCSPAYYAKIQQTNHLITDVEPHYDQLTYWAAHPDKWDPSDSISAVIADKTRDTSVDVFFLHPTSLTSKFVGDFNASLLNDTLNAKTDYSSILYQASVFNSQQNIYAPRYRQAHIYMYTYPDTVRAMEAFELAYSDVRKAFQYYLNLHRNKPIIIAAHSQGTQHAKKLIQEFIDTTEVRNKLVAAYLIGMPIVDGSFKTIPPCSDSTQTGCYVSWRTVREQYDGPDYVKKEKHVTVTNPLSWKTDTAVASKKLHKGAILMSYNKLIPAPNNAQVHGNLLWISRPRFPGSALYTTKNYHVGDYNLFYMNIREDVQRRIHYYKNNN